MYNEKRIDAILLHLTRSGRWQFIIFNFLSIAMMYISVCSILSHSFITFAPDHFRCDSVTTTTIPHEVSVNRSSTQSSGCNTYTINGTTSGQCTDGFSYTFRHNTVHSSIVSDYDLICGREYQSGLTFTVYVVGEIVGDFVIPIFADRWGRKPACVVCGLLTTIIGCVLSLSPNWYMFAGLKFLYGFFREGFVFSGIVWCMEMLPSRYRAQGILGTQLYWPILWLAYTLLAYLLRGWRSLQLVSNIIGLFTLSLIVFLPESLVWLLSNNKVKQFKRVIRKQADRVNYSAFDQSLLIINDDGATLPPDAGYFSDADKRSTTPVLRENGVFSILGNKRARFWSLLFGYMWFNCVLCYFGISFLAAVSPGDLYVNYVVSGLSEVPSYVLALLLVHRFGRRRPLIVHQLATTVILAVAACLPQRTDDPVMIGVQTALAALAKYSITLVYAVMVVYTPEVYPTNVRAVGNGLVVAISNVAQLMVPFTTDVFRAVAWLPFAVFAATSLVGVAAIYALPETNGRPLPQTFADMETLDAVFFPARRTSPPRDADDVEMET